MTKTVTIEQSLKQFGFIIHDVVGQSMLPLLKEGVNKVKLVEPINLSLFDVVLYKGGNNNYVLHRIVDINEENLTIIGDNNQHLEYKKKEDIVAKLDGYFDLTNYYDTKSKCYKEYLENTYPYTNENNRKQLILDAHKFFLERQKAAHFEIIKLEILGSINNIKINSLIPSEKNIFASEVQKQKGIQYLAFAINNFGVDLGQELNKKVCEHANQLLNVNVREDIAINQISEAFNKHSIPHIFLKGSETKKLYRYQELRTRNDIDVLVSPKYYKEATKVLKEELKGEYLGPTNHDESYMLPGLKVHVELHHTINEETPRDLKHILKNPFEDAIQVDGISRYILSNNKMLLYSLTHSAKHNRGGETWITMLLDFYYLSKQDFDYSLLKKSRIETYFNTLNHIFDHILNNKELSASETYFCDSWYENTTGYLNQVYKPKYLSRFDYYYDAIFLPFDNLVLIYPKLKEKPSLYNFYVFKRIVSILFSKTRRKRAKTIFKFYKKIYKKESLTMKEVGLGKY